MRSVASRVPPPSKIWPAPFFYARGMIISDMIFDWSDFFLTLMSPEMFSSETGARLCAV